MAPSSATTGNAVVLPTAVPPWPVMVSLPGPVLTMMFSTPAMLMSAKVRAATPAVFREAYEVVPLVPR